MTSAYAYALIFLCISIEVSPSVSQLLGVGDLLPGPGVAFPDILISFPDISKCLESAINVPGCVEEILTSFLKVQYRLIGPQCCKAALDIEDSCWIKILPFSSIFPLTLKSFCSIEGSFPPPIREPLDSNSNEDYTEN
ncbi:hypothetical protein BC332_27433 [Capsicum chinense]|nr:hypothetical protein BC332_27433 [Capsicum chinense]